jgi:hypothetical protein
VRSLDKRRPQSLAGLMFPRLLFITPMVSLLAQTVSPEVSQQLNTQEKIRLRQLELAVEKNLTGFIQCGRALLEIRESRLWRGRYTSF